MEKDSDKQESDQVQPEDQEEICEKIEKDSQYPATVPRCPMCKLTQELCEYSNKPKKCLEYYEKKDKDIYEDLKARIDAMGKKKKKAGEAEDENEGQEGEGENQPEGKPVEGETAEDKKEKKVSFAPEIEKPKEPKKPANQVIITVTRKKGKSFNTEIVGLEKFDIDEKKFCKPLGKKFATGASYQKGSGIIMQGDLADKMTDFILESFPDQLKASHIDIVRKN